MQTGKLRKLQNINHRCKTGQIAEKRGYIAGSVPWLKGLPGYFQRRGYGFVLEWDRRLGGLSELTSAMGH